MVLEIKFVEVYGTEKLAETWSVVVCMSVVYEQRKEELRLFFSKYFALMLFLSFTFPSLCFHMYIYSHGYFNAY